MSTLPCGCWDGPWWSTASAPRCDLHKVLAESPWAPLLGWPAPNTLSDSDIERIAQRIKELLKETK
jgi:hypothetical protein